MQLQLIELFDLIVWIHCDKPSVTIFHRDVFYHTLLLKEIIFNHELWIVNNYDDFFAMSTNINTGFMLFRRKKIMRTNVVLILNYEIKNFWNNQRGYNQRADWLNHNNTKNACSSIAKTVYRLLGKISHWKTVGFLFI